MEAAAVAQRQTLLVTVQGPERRVDLELPADRTVAQLVPVLAEICAAGLASASDRWQLRLPGGEGLPPGQTLAAAGVLDGTLLQLCDVGPGIAPAELPPVPLPAPLVQGGSLARAASPPPAVWEDGLTPQERLRLVLPPRASLAERLAEVAAGVVSPGGDGLAGLLRRVPERWKETSYLAGLEESIGRPRLQRCVTIAVVSPRAGVGTTTVAVLLGTLLALLRRDRVVPLDAHSVAPWRRGEASPAKSTISWGARKGDQRLPGVVLLDASAALHQPGVRAAVAAADQVVLVSDPDPETAQRVAEAAAALEAEGVPVWLVLNRLRRPARVGLQALGELVPQAQALVGLPEEPAGGRQLAAGRFCWQEAPTSWQEAGREVAVALVTAWAPLGLASHPG
jgi:hypothetical protein